MFIVWCTQKSINMLKKEKKKNVDCDTPYSIFTYESIYA